MYKRTPDSIRQSSAELGAAFALLQRLWLKDYQHMWAALQVGCCDVVLQRCRAGPS